MTGRRERDPLAHLARVLGIETSFVDLFGQRRTAEPDVLLRVLQALGAPLATAADATGALADVRRRAWQTLLPPVVVAWDRGAPRVGLRLPAAAAEHDVHVSLRHEARAGGAEAHAVVSLRDVPAAVAAEVDGSTYVRKFVHLPAPAGFGVHELEVECAGQRARSTMLAAPSRPGAADGRRTWGVFLPLYALRSEGDWGCGDFTALGALARFAADRGAGLVGTLPLDAPFLAAPDSPYTPSSRRLWNEIYVDVEAVPELAGCEAARELLASSAFRGELERLRGAPLVDHAAIVALKRRVLGELSRNLQVSGGARRAAFAEFLRRRPEVLDHGRFAAVQLARGAPWPTWPEALRAGRVTDEDHDPDSALAHAYAQWIASEQIEAAGRQGAPLYFDLPVGVHPDGYDTWREREAFLPGLSIGAPPDGFNARGQDWGLPPLHPRGIRAQGYRYFAECLRHHLRAAPWLRIDHVMAFHHAYVVPHGAGADRGVYVRYRPEEFHAVMCLEAEQAGGTIVGEDLGTVPPSVRAAMRRHGMQRMYVLPFELDAGREPPLATPDTDQLASLGTHDTATFFGYWHGLGSDVEHPPPGDPDPGSHLGRTRAALLRVLRERGFLAADASAPGDVMRAALAFLGASPARAVLANLEDLWLEAIQQNVPGTGPERPNWRKRARYTLAEMEDLEGVRQALLELRRARGGD